MGEGGMTKEPDERLREHGEWARVADVIMRARTSKLDEVRVYPRGSEEWDLVLREPFIAVSPSGEMPRWVEFSVEAVDAWYSNVILGRWRGQPVQVTGDPDEFTGLIEAYYWSDPTFAKAQGWLGDQYSGWTVHIPYAEIMDIEVRRTDNIAAWERLCEEGSVSERTPPRSQHHGSASPVSLGTEEREV